MTPANPDFADAVRHSFARQAMMATLGAELVAVDPGRVAIAAPVLAAATQQHGHAHAGLTFAIGDSAAGYAALSVQPAGVEVLTAEMKIHLLAPARGDSLIATGTVLKAGRRLVVVRADVVAVQDGRETHAATLLGTIVPVRAG